MRADTWVLSSVFLVNRLVFMCGIQIYDNKMLELYTLPYAQNEN